MERLDDDLLKSYYFNGDYERDQQIQKKRDQMQVRCKQLHEKVFNNVNKMKQKDELKQQKRLRKKMEVDKQREQELEDLKNEIDRKQFEKEQRKLQKEVNNQKFKRKQESIKDIFKPKQNFMDHIFMDEQDQQRATFYKGQELFNTQSVNQSQQDKQLPTISPVKRNSMVNLNSNNNDNESRQQHVPEYMKPNFPLNSLELRQQVLKADLRGVPYRCSGFGLEKTPYYEMEMEREQKKKRQEDNLNDMKLKGYIFAGNQDSEKKLDLKKIYNKVKYLRKVSQPTQAEQSLLNRKLQQALQESRLEWGRDQDSKNNSLSIHNPNNFILTQIPDDQQVSGHQQPMLSSKTDQKLSKNLKNQLSIVDSLVDNSITNLYNEYNSGLNQVRTGRNLINRKGQPTNVIYTTKNYVKIKV